MRILIVLLVLTAAAAVAAELTPLDQKVLQQLTKTRESQGIVFHYEPDLPGDAVSAAIRRNVGFRRDLEKAMRLRFEERIHIFLYADAARMKVLTGSEAAALSTGRNSIHQPHDYDDAHEMVHLFALHIPKGEEHVPPEGFFVEGLATALQHEDNGIAIDDYAAIYLQAGRLPRLVELRRSWMQGPGTGVHPYHVAGSWMGFLIERFGIEKVKRLYVNCLECEAILGHSFVRTEREWWDWLSKRKVPAKARDLVLRRLGYTERHRLPAGLAQADGVPLFDGRTLEGWNLEHPRSWKTTKGLIVGETDGPWHRIHTREQWSGDAAVRVRLRLVEGNALQIRLNRNATCANEAIFAAWQSYLVRIGPGGGVLMSSPYRILPGHWIDVVFVNRNGAGSVYVDGILMLEADNLAVNEGAVGLSVERGRLEVREVRLLRPDGESRK